MAKKDRKIRPKIYILCNGELAEPLYFVDFKNYLAIPQQIIVRNKEFIRKAPWEFITAAIQYKMRLVKESKFSSEHQDQMWCVFDVDNYWQENEKKFRVALHAAKKHNLRLAWSNQCFELWFLCHFDQSISAIPRSNYHKKLGQHFKNKQLGGYNKNMQNIFEKLLPFQRIGIKNAENLHVENKVAQDPSTAVFLLTKELLGLKK